LRQGGSSEKVDLQNIELLRIGSVLKGYVLPLSNLGEMKKGDWDLFVEPIVDMDVYDAITKRFNKTAPWVETHYYNRVLGNIKSGKVKWGCKTKGQLDKRFNEIDALLHDISERGVLSIEQLSLQGDKRPFHDDIKVCIGRSGEYILYDGRHRACAAKVLGIKKIPVRVSFRHQIWAKFCNEVKAYSVSHKTLYAPITHPDLSEVKSAHGEERFLAIKNNLPISSGSVLDIGSHWGYFCHKLEEEGFDCSALEHDANNLYFMRKLKQAEKRKFEILPISMLDLPSNKRFDIILALYIFHHFLKVEKDLEMFINFLQSLNAKYMFFAAHDPSEKQMEGAYLNMGPERFADFILEHTSFVRKKLILGDGMGRSLYLLQ